MYAFCSEPAIINGSPTSTSNVMSADAGAICCIGAPHTRGDGDAHANAASDREAT